MEMPVQKKPSKTLPRVFSFLLFTLFLFSSLLFALPSLISTDMGKEKMLEILNGSISGRIEAEHLQLSWFGKQKLKGVRIFDDKNQEILSIETIYTTASLLNLFSHPDLTAYENKFTGMHAKIIDDGQGITNLHKVLFSVPKTSISSPQLEVELIQVNGSIIPNLSTKQLRFQFNGKTRKDGMEGSFTIDAQLNRAEFYTLLNDRSSLIPKTEEGISLSAHLENFPVLILDQLLSIYKPTLQGVLLETFGDQIQLKIDQIIQKDLISFELDLKSPTFFAYLPGTFKNGSFVLNGQGQIRGTLPSRLLQNQEIKFAEALPVYIELDQLDLSPPFDLNHLSLQGTVQSDKVSLNLSQGNQRVTLDNVQAKVAYLPNGDQSNLNIHLQGKAVDAPFNIELQTRMIAQRDKEIPFWKSSFVKMDPNHPVEMHATVENFTLAILKQFFPNQPNQPDRIAQLQAIFGSRIQTTLHAQVNQLNGSFNLSILGDNGRTSVDGQINKGILTLNKNLSIDFNLTPVVSQTLLQETAPLLAEMLGSDRSIAIRVDKNEFILPLYPFALTKLQIGKGSIDLGQVKFVGNGKLAQSIKFINAVAGNAIPVWFTPIYFSFNEGILYFQRFDFLLMGEYPFAIWGKVNFVKNKTQLTLGVSGKTIAQAFGVKNFPFGILVQVPIKGSVQNPTLDTKKATAKITALAAQQQGIKGKLIGSLLNFSAGVDDEPSPQPTTNPLPWQSLFDEVPVEKSIVDQVVLDPIQEAGKGAVNLIKNIIRG